MKTLILLLTITFSLYGFSLSDIKNYASKAKSEMDHYKKEYNEYNGEKETKKDRSINVKVLKNNSILKKQIFARLDCDDIYSNKVVDTCYSNRNKGSLATAYTIDGKLVYEVDLKKREKWTYNRKIPKIYRSTNADYIRTGYDKGHLAMDSAFDYSSRVLKNTYDLNINAVPMAANVNRKLWLKAESYSKKMASKLGKVNVVDIIEYDKYPKRIGRNRIAVPANFYKIIYNQKKDFMKCFYYENELDMATRGDRMEDHFIDCKEIFN